MLPANGCADLYYEYGIHIWDMAAAYLIAKEAGCVIMDPEDGKELNLVNRRILISATRELAEETMPLINTVFYQPD